MTGEDFARVIAGLAEQHESACAFRVAALDYVAGLDKPTKEDKPIAMMVQVVRYCRDSPAIVAAQCAEIVSGMRDD